MSNLFEDNGATFSECGKYRYELHRIWDKSLPLVMFIGLNPSTANAAKNDNTITKVIKIAKANGYGGVYMMNLFSYISTDPEKLIIDSDPLVNDIWLRTIRLICRDVVFAWGNFKIATGRAKEVESMFTGSCALHINANGSPKHPLYCKDDTKFVSFN